MKYLTRFLKAVTTIELIIVISVLGLVMSGLGTYVYQAMRVWSLTSYRQEVVSQVRLGVQKMVDDIRQISNRSALERNTTTELWFNTSNSGRIGYSYSAVTRALYYNQGGVIGGAFNYSNPLMEGLNSFAFEYYDQNDTSTGGYNNTTTRLISLNVTITSGSETNNIITKVAPRNF